MTRFGFFLLAGFLLFGSGCDDSESPGSYEDRVMQERIQRDMQMREKESVLPPDRRTAFRGLDYFPVDTAYRFVVPFQRQSAPDTVMLAENTGRMREQVRVGNVTLPLSPDSTRLVVFEGAGDSPRGRLWIPFGDATNGDSTYEAGRYVDLTRTGGDSVVVDFNRAYNPTCVYNPEYVCPLPPTENRLTVPVPAGEKMPSFVASGQTRSIGE